MTRFVTVNLQCDWSDCDTVAPEEDGLVVEKELAIDRKQPKVFLLCKEHLDAFETVVLPLMQAGIKVEAPVKKTTKNAGAAGTSTGTSTGAAAHATGAPAPDGTVESTLVCRVPRCSRHGRPLHNRTGMAQHVIRTHGYDDLAAYEQEFGPVYNKRVVSSKGSVSTDATVDQTDRTVAPADHSSTP